MCSQVPETCPYPEPDEPTPRLPIILDDTFTSTLVSAKQFTLNHQLIYKFDA